MATIAGINTTSVTETIPTESINPMLIPAPNFLRVYEQITWQVPVSGKKHVWPQWDTVAVTGTQTETDELTPTSMTTNKEEIAPGMVGLYAFRSDQTSLEGSSVTPEAQIAKMADETENRIDKDVLALFVVSPNQADNTGDNLDLDNFDAALAQFYAQKPTQQRIAFVGSVNQIRDLRKAIRQSGNGGLVMGAGLSVFNGLPLQGKVGEWQGVEIYQGNVTQADASNDNGGFCACAPLGSSGPAGIMPGSGLGLAVWEGLKAEVQREITRKGDKYVVSSMYGAAITADCNVLGFISKKAA